jgi:hypothetical protein
MGPITWAIAGGDTAGSNEFRGVYISWMSWMSSLVNCFTKQPSRTSRILSKTENAQGRPNRSPATFEPLRDRIFYDVIARC